MAVACRIHDSPAGAYGYSILICGSPVGDFRDIEGMHSGFEADDFYLEIGRVGLKLAKEKTSCWNINITVVQLRGNRVIGAHSLLCNDGRHQLNLSSAVFITNREDGKIDGLDKIRGKLTMSIPHCCMNRPSRDVNFA